MTSAQGTPAARGVDTKPHVAVLNCWRDRYAEYDEYLDHRACHVTYVTTRTGQGSVPPEASANLVVDRTDDVTSVRPALTRLAESFGAPEAIVALKESDLLVAAVLREEWDCRGPRVESVIAFRDKYLMYSTVAAAGLPIPPFAIVADEQQAREFAERHGWPIVLKPRRGQASEGITCATGPTELKSAFASGEPLVAQSYVPHPIYHVDGVFTGVDLGIWRASRYVNSCLSFRSGAFLGSIESDEEAVNDLIAHATRRYLRALTDTPIVFHLELFVDREARGHDTSWFLEVGARAGGAENAFVWREVHGYDLMAAATALQRGLPLPEESATDRGLGGRVGGHLLVPAPLPRPCRIVSATSMTGREPGPYAESVPQPGEVLPASGAFYEHVGGRFRFRAESSELVRKAVLETAAAYRVRAEPLDSAAARADGDDARRPRSMLDPDFLRV